MEKAIKKLMGNNLPPRFKFKDTYDSIEVPAEYQQHLPTQQQLETEFDEMLDQEEALPTIDAVSQDLQVISANVYSNTATGAFGIGTATPDYTLHVDGDAGITSNLTVGTANLFVDTTTGNVGIGTASPGYMLDVTGSANVGALTTTSGAFSGDLTVSGKIYNYNYTEVDINAPDVVSGTWTTGISSRWGDPKFNNTYDRYRYNDAPGYVEYTIPTGMKSAYISQLQWNSGGYVDVHGVQSDGGLVFLRRINTRQNVENTNEGNPDQYDGQTITFVGSGLEHYSNIRLTNKLGRFHLDGLAFTPNENEGTEGTGMVHSAQISDLGSGIPTPTGTGASGTWGINITGNADTVDNLHASSFLRSDADDTVNAGVTYSWAATDTHGLSFTNSSYSGYYLYIGGWTSSNDNNISRIRNSSGNLHIDSAANGNLYLNNYSGGQVISKGGQNILQSTTHNYVQSSQHNYVQSSEHNYMQATNYNYLSGQRNYVQGQNNYLQGITHIATGSYIAGSRFETYGSGSNKVCRIKNTEDDDSVYYAFRNEQSILQREVTAVIQGYMQHSSDDRIKTNEQHLTDGLDVIKRLKPQRYDKLHDLLENQDPTSNSYGLSEKHETGFIAQDIYYEIPELRHLVHVGGGYTPDENVTIPDDPTQDPDYSSWGNVAASVSYTEIIPYNTAAIQDLSKLRDDDVSRISILENQLLDIVSRLETLESKVP
jgi:hypothetical protein